MGLTAIPDALGRPIVAGGFLIQALPGASENILDLITGRIWDLPPLGQTPIAMTNAFVCTSWP